MRQGRYFAAALMLVARAATAQDVQYEKYTLENGMTVILHEDHSLPVACINTWYYVGGKDEPPGRSGFAHLFEHLMFMGTRRVPDNQFDVLMEQGGGWNNASTSWDRTNYYSFGPASLLPTLLWLDADRLEDLSREMTQAKLDKQREVVRNERRQTSEMQPYGKAELKISELMYPPGHPYHIEVIGTHEDLERATVQDVKDFFETFYVPNNASLVVAGDFDPADVKPLVAKLFGTLPRDADPVHARAEPVTLSGVKRVTYSDDVQFARLTLVYHSPAEFARGDAEMDLAADVLATGKSSRLYKRLVIEDKLATEVNAYQSSGHLGSLFQVHVTAREGVPLDDIERVTDEVLAAFVAEGPTGEELERHKAAQEYSMLQGLESLLSKADALNKFQFYFNEPNSFKRDLDRYRNATTTGVREWAQRVLTPNARLMMRVLPEKNATMLAGRDQRPADLKSRNFAPPPPTVFKLSNGVEVRHWRRSELPLVEMSLLFKQAGSVYADHGSAGRACLTASMLDEGAGDRDALAFSDALDLLGATFSARADREDVSASLSVLKRNLDKAAALYADAILRPRFDAKEWDRVKRLHLESLRQAEDRASTVASRVGLLAYYGPEHPYGRPLDGTIDSVEALSLDSLRECWRQSLVPGNAVFFVAGDLTADEAKAVLDRHFGRWQSPPGWAPATLAGINESAPGPMRVVLVDKPGSVQTVIRFFMPGPKYAHPMRIQHELLNTILGGSFTSRLNQNLREDKGYTYGARSSFTMAPNAGYFTATADVQAEVTGAALKEFLAEFRRIRGGDISAGEVQKTRETNRAELIQGFQVLSGLITMAQLLESRGRPFASLADDFAAIQRAGEHELNALASDAIPLEHALLVLVGDKRTILPQIEGLGLPTPQERNARGDAIASPQ